MSHNAEKKFSIAEMLVALVAMVFVAGGSYYSVADDAAEAKAKADAAEQKNIEQDLALQRIEQTLSVNNSILTALAEKEGIIVPSLQKTGK